MNSIQCITCKHYLGLNQCEAFEDKIPDVIITGLFDHTSPFPNDNDIQYEPIIELEDDTE